MVVNFYHRSITNEPPLAVCVASQCQITTCPEKYTFKEGVCVKDPVRQRARVKKEKNKKPTLCPAKEETACPIAGSA